MTYLELVTECEHGESVKHPKPGATPSAIFGAAAAYSVEDWCAEGSRVRVEPDLATASNVLRRYVPSPRLAFGKLTELVLDAALGLGESDQ